MLKKNKVNYHKKKFIIFIKHSKQVFFYGKF